VFPLTRPTLNFSPDPRNCIDPLKKNRICSQNMEHIFVFVTSAKIWAVLHVYRGSTDTGKKAFVQFNENSHNCVWICIVFTWIGNKIKKKIFPTYLPYFFTMLAETQHIFLNGLMVKIIMFCVYREYRISGLSFILSYCACILSYRATILSYPIVRVSYRIVCHVKNKVTGTVYPEIRVCSVLGFVFPTGFMRLITVCYLCYFIVLTSCACWDGSYDHDVHASQSLTRGRFTLWDNIQCRDCM
jgi:hypothetical protein